MSNLDHESPADLQRLQRMGVLLRVLLACILFVPVALVLVVNLAGALAPEMTETLDRLLDWGVTVCGVVGLGTAFFLKRLAWTDTIAVLKRIWKAAQRR